MDIYRTGESACMLHVWHLCFPKGKTYGCSRVESIKHPSLNEMYAELEFEGKSFFFLFFFFK